jgi:riboflavin synthase
MFTGIVEDLGTVRGVTRRGADSARLRIATGLDLASVRGGDSIAVDGCCLTVVSLGSDSFEADAGAETLRVTTLGERQVGDPVHLERAVRMGDRLGGHLVSGHVDAVGHVASRTESAHALELTFGAPPSFMKYLVIKGSIAVDGVSLTVNTIDDAHHTFSVLLIPHTLEHTHLGQKSQGARVNLEGDLVGKYVLRLASPFVGGAVVDEAPRRREPMGLGFLEEHGFAKPGAPRK